MIEHSPGPWKFIAKDKLLFSSEEKLIAELFSTRQYFAGDVRAILAAPELLAACEGLYRVFGHNGLEVCHEARRAIARARGIKTHNKQRVLE